MKTLPKIPAPRLTPLAAAVLAAAFAVPVGTLIGVVF